MYASTKKVRANKRCVGKNTAILTDVQNSMSAFVQPLKVQPLLPSEAHFSVKL